MSSLDSREKLEAYVRQVATHRKWTLNGDQEFTQGIIEGLTSNAVKLGYPLCPCRESVGNRQDDQDIVCPCSYAQEDIVQWGQCFCGLFLSKDKSIHEVSSIPERRPER